MKYKIKVEVNGHGDSLFYPMVKAHWWSPWMHIDGGFPCKTIEFAKTLIEDYHYEFLKKTVERVYDIPIEIEEE